MWHVYRPATVVIAAVRRGVVIRTTSSSLLASRRPGELDTSRRSRSSGAAISRARHHPDEFDEDEASRLHASPSIATSPALLEPSDDLLHRNVSSARLVPDACLRGEVSSLDDVRSASGRAGLES